MPQQNQQESIEERLKELLENIEAINDGIDAGSVLFGFFDVFNRLSSQINSIKEVVMSPDKQRYAFSAKPRDLNTLGKNLLKWSLKREEDPETIERLNFFPHFKINTSSNYFRGYKEKPLNYPDRGIYLIDNNFKNLSKVELAYEVREWENALAFEFCNPRWLDNTNLEFSKITYNIKRCDYSEIYSFEKIDTSNCKVCLPYDTEK